MNLTPKEIGILQNLILEEIAILSTRVGGTQADAIQRQQFSVELVCALRKLSPTNDANLTEAIDTLVKAIDANATGIAMDIALDLVYKAIGVREGI